MNQSRVNSININFYYPTVSIAGNYVANTKA